MGTIAQQIVRLQGAKGDIKTAIHAQGIPVPSAVKMDGIAPYIEQINTGVHDLSYYDVFGNFKDEQTTANSYVVREAGKYKIPLVYGCGIKDGWSNPASFTRQGTTYTADFVNYKGNVITSPYIETDTSETAASAGLLWQTAVGMITSVSLVNGVNCRYLQFNVASVPATNGLAVLWIKDGNDDIMWSWTIWCTNDDLSTFKLTNHTNVEYEMLGVPFGAIWDANREHYVLPYYQWGRKDAMCPESAYNSTTKMILYDLSGNVYTGYGVYGRNDDADAGGTVRSVSNSIMLPNKFFVEYDSTNHNWNNLAWYNNYWNAVEVSDAELADNQNTAIKTIYDPMPVGWTIPSGRFATGFTTTGSNSTSLSQLNVIGSFNNGWNFKKSSSDTVGIFFPIAGSINRGGGNIEIGSFGLYWTYAPASQIRASILSFSSSGVNPLTSHHRSLGFTIWPTKDLVQNNNPGV